MMVPLRRDSLYKKIIFSLIVLNLVGLIIYSISAKVISSQQGLYNPHVAKTFERYGIMSRPEYTRFASLHTQLSQNKSLSDGDIDWLIGLTTGPSQSGTLPVSSAIRHDAALELLQADVRAGGTTVTQKDKIFNAAVPLLASKEGTGIDVISATNVLRTLNDKRAIPLLVPLIDSPNVQVRSTAVNSLKVMGYNPGT